MFRLFHVQHDGVFLGGISVVFASDEDEARETILQLLAQSHLKPKIFEITEIEIKRGAVMLWNGDY